MKLYRSLEQLPEDFRAGAVAIGNFDGVHLGHARIMEQLVRRAQEFDGPSVVFTFEPHPVRLLRPEVAPPPLTWVDRKAELLKQLNVDVVIAYPTDRQFLRLSAASYFEEIVRRRLQACAVVEGPNFYFGRDREGDVERLRELCVAHDITLDVVAPLRRGHDFVSSSRVRTAIADGAVAEANEMLTEPYRIRGMVTHGAGRGQTLGIPTANVSAVDTLLPQPGVYAGWAWAQQASWPAAINIGPNPTFGENQLKVEVHLIGFQGSLYGEPLEVDFIRRLRDIQRFGDLESLKSQILADVEQARLTLKV